MKLYILTFTLKENEEPSYSLGLYDSIELSLNALNNSIRGFKKSKEDYIKYNISSCVVNSSAVITRLCCEFKKKDCGLYSNKHSWNNNKDESFYEFLVRFYFDIKMVGFIF